MKGSGRWGCPRELQTWASQHGLSVAATEGFISPAENSEALPRAGGVSSSCFRTCFSGGTHLQSRNPGAAPRRIMPHNMAPWQKPGVAFDLSQPTGAALWTYLVSYLERIQPRELSTVSRHLQGFFTFWQRRAAAFCSVCFAVWILFSN